MNLGDISYAEFSLLRELVRAKQMDIWQREWAPRLKKGTTIEEAEKSFQETMNDKALYEAHKKWGVAAPLTDRGCCSMLLYRFDEEEKKIRKTLELKGGKIE